MRPTDLHSEDDRLLASCVAVCDELIAHFADEPSNLATGEFPVRDGVIKNLEGEHVGDNSGLAVTGEGKFAHAVSPEIDESTDAEREALEHAFYDWWADNAHALDTGYCGDVFDLRLRLIAAFPNSCNSDRSTSKALAI